MFLQMANPDYATLLPQIAAEADSDAKQLLINQCFQFNEPLTLEEQSLFSYTTPDGIENNDYIIDNPGLIQGNLYVSYVGDYYNRYAQSTSSTTDNIYGGPFYVYGTGKTGFGTGQLGFFYPLYTDVSQIDGTYHIHTFEEYVGYTFYMPDTEMTHAVSVAPDDMFEYGDFDVVLTAATTITEQPAQEQQEEEQPAQEEQEETPPSTTTQSITVAVPSLDGTTNNYGGITGLTVTKTTTTSTTSSGFVVYRTFNAGAQGGPTGFYPTSSYGWDVVGYGGSDTYSRIDVRLRRTLGNSVNAKIANTQHVSTGGLTQVDTTGSSHLLTNAAFGSYRYNVGDNSRMVEEQNRYTTTTTITYSFTNNTGYSVTIEGTTLANGAGPTEITPTGDVNITYTTEN